MPPLSSTGGFKAGGKFKKAPERIKTKTGKMGQRFQTGENKEGGHFFAKIIPPRLCSVR
jgi:hypothetical protein